MVDYKGLNVTVFDGGGTSLTPLSTVPIPGVSLFAQVVNETTHHLFVLDGSGEQVFAVDVDPGSASSGKVVGSWKTFGKGGTAIAVDSVADVVYVANSVSNDVSLIDVATGSVRREATGREPTDVVVDSATHHAFISSTVDSTITTVFPTGSSTTRLENRPLKLAFGGGALVVSTDRPLVTHLESYDPTSMTKVATSAPLGTAPQDFSVDDSQHLVLVATAGGGVPGIQALRSDTLAVEGGGDEDYFNSITVDQVTHRVFVAQTPRPGPDKSQVVMYDAHPSPLPAVERVGGVDRFAVSAAVSASTFYSGVPIVYVASGTGFADALSGSAAAGAQRGPVLLVTKDAVPPVIGGELTRLRPQRIVVLGGTASISAAVQTQLGTYSTSVSRIAGADRYEVSAAVSKAAFPGGSATVYLASGEVFPDALSGSAAAGHDHAPVLLLQKGVIPPAVQTEITRLKPSNIIVLGGPNTISEPVVAALGATAPVTRVDGADRFAVSAASATRASPVRAYTVYVASGEVFPDALSGSAAAIADDAPVLLVTREGVPAPVAAQLDRLRPYRIVVLGGQNSVSDTVLEQLNSYLPG
ncbi:cell wall-binding repeat-containing protein [Herbiconiux sp. YIM B11900]|uniref:cell wall-binding repeat-containing protein n=1 Tax=Herbiconiux sp. YIM B11900 TaxID=3404131 RepID=UPI003F87C115